MYNVKEKIDLTKYGFAKAKNLPDHERWCCNKSDLEDYWLIAMNLDEPEEVDYADEDFDQPTWSIHIQNTGRMWIECVPSCTYHIDNSDMEKMFYVLKLMIEDGVIEDDFCV